MKKLGTLVVVLLIMGEGVRNLKAQPAPKHYLCYRAEDPPEIDGKLDEIAWGRTAWTDDFVDIEGPRKPAPRFRTRVKMLWDDTYLYVAAELEEPHVWATLTERDAVIFHDNDFEVFIDPDGDTHRYYELEVNALGTVWDLLLFKPYRDGGPPLDGWDIHGLKVGVSVQGSLNRPRDTDRGWSIELALPWSALKEAAPGRRAPRPGEQWRINFSRVEWRTDVRDGRYEKRRDPDTGKPLPEDNWVWTPQYAVAMHRPEHWGYVQFSGQMAGAGTDAFVAPADAGVRTALRALYERQQRFRKEHGHYATSLKALGRNARDSSLRATLYSSPGGYVITAPGPGGSLAHIREDGRLWITTSKTEDSQ